MDETPEEMEQIRRDAALIDPLRYKKRLRLVGIAIMVVVVAGMVWLALEARNGSRNPCERLRDHLCAQAPTSLNCTTYDGIFKESVEDESPKMRSLVRQQCETKISRLKEEDGVVVR